jgi:hypothetical protein
MGTVWQLLGHGEVSTTNGCNFLTSNARVSDI